LRISFRFEGQFQIKHERKNMNKQVALIALIIGLAAGVSAQKVKPAGVLTPKTALKFTKLRIRWLFSDLLLSMTRSSRSGLLPAGN
jgi:hypothetical protein